MNREILDYLGGVFADYTKMAGAIHQELGKETFTLQMLWQGFQVFADVTPIVKEAAETGKISAEGGFRDLIDDLIVKFAYEIVKRHEKMEKKEKKEAMRQSKVLRLVDK